MPNNTILLQAQPYLYKQSGFVLVTGLILLLVITIASLTSMKNSVLGYKISANTAFNDVAFQASESARAAAGEAVKNYIWDRSWTGFTIHSGLSRESEYNPLKTNGIFENQFRPSTLEKDMDFNIAKSGDVDEIDADVFIIRSPTATGASGAGMQQLAGYRGAGKGAGSSGSYLYFELRSLGYSAGGAETTTASEYRAYLQ